MKWNMEDMYRERGFTLIELLIVVAIIGILAAIAVPNFLNARFRAQIAKVESELKSIETALESYRIDNSMYPVWHTFEGVNKHPVSARLNPLTSPVSYIASVPQDPFLEKINGRRINDSQHEAYDSYDYVDAWTAYNTLKEGRLDSSYRCAEWRVASAGPDYNQTFGSALTYAPSNGLNSTGDIVRTGPRVSRPCDPSLVGK
ncbi:MAG: prepilin-type N-terminal cleavage/methylation domain-containing protein [bacterium]